MERRETPEEEDARFTTSLAGLAVALFLTVVGLYIVEGLAAESQLEDCALQGRKDCVRVELSPVRWQPLQPR